MPRLLTTLATYAKARGAGLSVMVKGRAAGGATRRSTEARGAGLSVMVKGSDWTQGDERAEDGTDGWLSRQCKQICSGGN